MARETSSAHARVKPAEMHDVVSRLCGLHAQLTSSAELSLLARVEGLDPSALRDALWKERSLVKLWAMRGTLHMFASDEYPMWQAGARHVHAFPQARVAPWVRRHRDRARSSPRRGRAGAGRASAHPRGARRRGRAADEVEAAGGAGARELGIAPQAGVVHGQALLRTGQGPQRGVHGSEEVAPPATHERDGRRGRRSPTSRGGTSRRTLPSRPTISAAGGAVWARDRRGSGSRPLTRVSIRSSQAPSALEQPRSSPLERRNGHCSSPGPLHSVRLAAERG